MPRQRCRVSPQRGAQRTTASRPAVAPPQTVLRVSAQLPRSEALPQQGAKLSAFGGHGGDGRFRVGSKAAQIVLKLPVFNPNRLPLRTLHCLGVALFNLFVSAKYLALDCNSP